jgi:hypothetical protein
LDLGGSPVEVQGDEIVTLHGDTVVAAVKGCSIACLENVRVSRLDQPFGARAAMGFARHIWSNRPSATGITLQG